jgi:hypothetical protein
MNGRGGARAVQKQWQVYNGGESSKQGRTQTEARQTAIVRVKKLLL